jgi:glycosyltransferase involved in cell wall biosynthesis
MIIFQVMGMRSNKFGGIERFMLTLASKLQEKKHQLIIIYESMPTSSFYIDSLQNYGAEIIILSSRGKKVFYFIRHFTKLLITYKPEIIHCHFDPAGYLALTVAWILRVKGRYRTIHGMLSNMKNEEIQSKRKLKLKTIIFKHLMYNLSTQLFSVSEEIRIQYGQIFGENAKIKTLYLGVNNIVYNKQLSREKYGLPLNKLIIGCVAFHDSIKGVDLLLEAIAYIRVSYPELNDFLVCQIGSGTKEQTEKLKTLVNTLHIESSILWLGLQDNVPELLSAFDIYCQPSRSEGIPLSIMEASIAQLPVVATKVGGIPEVVKDGVTGFLVTKGNVKQLGDKLYALLINESDRKSMGRQAKLYSEKTFNIEFQVNKLLAYYSI